MLKKPRPQLALTSILAHRIDYEEFAYTYEKLLEDLLAIKNKHPDYMKQSVQVIKSNPLPTADECLPCVGISTCDEWGLNNTLNADDHKHHGKQLVFLVDHHTFGENGEIAFEKLPDGSTKSIFPENSPKWRGE